MRITPRLRMDIAKVMVITFCYTLISVFIAFFNDALLHSVFTIGVSKLYEFKAYLLINILSGFIAGIVGGSALVTVNSRLFRKKSFGYSILATAVVYILTFCLVTVIGMGIGVLVQLGNEATINEYAERYFELFWNPTSLNFFVLWFVITLFTLFLLQVNDKFGPGILAKFLKGKYHRPKKEQRFFMFLDMRSSTTIAEKLSNEQYFNLLSDLFNDITDTILDHEGEIYQYVGDEIVISWTMKKGIKKANCLHCFIQIQKKLISLSQHYEYKYGLTPEFKAGLHCGTVMAGEIGSIKKDIVYSGDVLNTTARIQELCNQYKVDFLLSKKAFDLMEDSEQFELISLGIIDLRGKESQINLNTLRLS